MNMKQAKQQIVDQISDINGFLTIWDPTTESILAVKLGIKTAREVAQSELDEYTERCTKAFDKVQG